MAGVEHSDQDERCRRFRAFLAGLGPDTLDSVDAVAAPTIHFRDPFNDAIGREAVKKVYAALFEEIDLGRFTVSDCACSATACYVRWQFSSRPRRLGKGHPWSIDGVSELRFDQAGLIATQVDYWDAGRHVYERLPLFGQLMRRIRKRLAAV